MTMHPNAALEAMNLSVTKTDYKPLRILYGIPEGQDARLLGEKARILAKERSVLVHVALDDHRTDLLKDLLHFFAPDVAVVDFPAWDCLPYDRISPSADIVAKRVDALCTILSWQKDEKYLPRIVLTTVNSFIQKVTPPHILEHSSFTAKVGSFIDTNQLIQFLGNNGYIRSDTVRESGEFALRGSIIDIFPSGYALPVRIDLFGNEVETIKSFDPLTQRTEEKMEQFLLKPATEFFLDDNSITHFRRQYREAFGAVKEDDPLYAAISEGRRYNGMDHWLPFFFDKPLSDFIDYMPCHAITADAQTDIAMQERLNQIADFYAARKTLESTNSSMRKNKKSSDVSLTGAIYHPVPSFLLYQDSINILKNAEIFSPFQAPDVTDVTDTHATRGRDFSDIRSVSESNVIKEVTAYIAGKKSEGKKVVIAAYSEGSRERMKIMLKEAGFDRLKNCHSFDDVHKIKKEELGMAILSLEHGFISDDSCFISEQDILGDRLVRKNKKRKKAENFLTEVSSLNVGDLVVHVDHGIGRFEGLETLSAGGNLHDCLKIVYADDDKLFVPVENIEVLSRFGSDEGFSQLDKLGGAGWQARKARVKKDLMRIAEHLMKIAAARVLRKAEKLFVDKEHYNSFSARFPYHETEDQLRAIESVVEDMAGDYPMDRLVCGDVGFGKTEVALRAAYVAAMAGVQVAVVVPTTLLARQHYAGFCKRFEGLGVRIGQLSRMVTAKEAEDTKKGLADGSVSIVIGTHAIFSKDVKFHHLSLLIVDEEQKFGVKQKERLKEIKSDVHVLTLTATPIPRTLQMSLTGVKEMSLITTPPVDRLAIRSFILPYDALVIREALMREHYRGGQSFYVVPRISDMEDVQAQLKEIVPELKVVTATGQMSAGELEDKMTAFYDGQYDILLATNIIESGLDIPRANTMIIHRSDMFGLAQLYQIRGRIGRSKVRAYAYLTYDPLKKLTPQGQKRLEVMETLDKLGAGFQLASHDMDIRGAGNLLGEEQSGHVREVGIELYQQMLEEAVALAKAGVDIKSAELIEGKWSPQINIGTSVLIPEDYVEDLSVRMSLYRRLADMDSKDEVESFAAELIDRFGILPAEVENLLDIVSIKHLCRKAHVDHVEAGPKGAVIGFYKGVAQNPAKVMQWIVEKKGSIKIRPKDQKLVVVRQWDAPAERVKGIQAIMRELAAL